MIVVRRGVQRDPDRVQQEMEQVFRALMPARPRVAARQKGAWRPPLEVFATDEALVVIAELAGMDERQLTVVVDQDVLALRGERPDPCHGGSPGQGGQSGQAEKRSYREAGILYGAFEADVYIPFPIDPDGAVADYHNGFLRIVLPKMPARTIVPRRPELDGRG